MELKKWTVMMVLSLFLVSIVPAAFAEDGTSSDDTSDAEDAADDAADEAEDAADDAEDTADETAKTARELTAERLKESREKVREANKRVIEARKDVLDARKDFMKTRDKIRAKDATLADKQAFLLASSDKVLELLVTLKARVEASDAENKVEILADIDASITAMTDAQETVEGIDTDTATREEIKAAAEQMRDAWKDARSVLKSGAGRVVTNRVGLVIARMDAMDDKLDRIVAHLEEHGNDMSATIALQASFEAKLESAEANWKSAKALYADGDVEAAHTALIAANADLKEAHRLLKEIIVSIRSTTKSGEFESAEAEVGSSTEAETGDDDADDSDSADDVDGTDDESDSESDDSADDSDEDSASTETTIVSTDIDASVDTTAGVVIG